MITPHRTRVALVVGATVVALWLLWQARVVLLPFLVGMILAHLLVPLVNSVSALIPRTWMSDGQARGLVVALVYLVGMGLLALLGFLIVPPLVEGTQDLFARRAELLQQAQHQFDASLAFYQAHVPEFIREQVTLALEELNNQLGRLIQTTVQRTMGVLTQTLAVLLGFLALPIWLMYVLKDQPLLSTSFYEMFPKQLQPDVRHLLTSMSHLLGSYIRVQLTLALFVGLMAWLGLFFLQVPFAIPLAVVASVTELIPVLGPVIGAAVAIIVTLAVEPGSKVLWVLLLYMGIQQIENVILVPRLQGRAFHLHPAIVIMLLVVAGELYGIWGMIFIVPLTALARDTFVYIYRRLGEAGDTPEPAPRRGST